MFEEYKEVLKQMLSEKRYIHSLGVSTEAKELAALNCVDLYKAELAGLVHDCAKNIPNDELPDICKSFGYTPDETEEKNLGLIHAPLGACMIKSLFGIDDSEIESAVRNHTVAAREMTTLDKIIYLADMTEPSRSYPEVEHLRQLSRESLDEAFLTALDYSLIFNISKGVVIHPNTLEARNTMIYKKLRKNTCPSGKGKEKTNGGN